MANEKEKETQAPSERKGFACAFDLTDPAEKKVYQLLSVAKSVGNVPAKKIVELGVKAYLQTPDFKEKAAIIKGNL